MAPCKRSHFFVYIRDFKMFVSEIRDYSNSVAFCSLKGFKPKEEDIFRLNRQIGEQVQSAAGAFKNLYYSLRKLMIQENNNTAQELFGQIKSKHNIKNVAETISEGITFSSEKTNFVLSTHGANTFRLREQNPVSGEIEKSYFFKDAILIKTDTKDIVPETLEPMGHNDINRDDFYKEFTPKLDEVDFALVKLRRDIASPEIQTEIKKVDPAVTQALVRKHFILEGNAPVLQTAPKPAPATEKPKKKLLSYYEKLLMEQRAQNAVKPSKPKEKKAPAVKAKPPVKKAEPPKTVSVEPVITTPKRKGRKPKTITEQPQVVKESKRRGRPSKHVQTGPAGSLADNQPIIDSIFANYSYYKKEFVNLGVPRRKKVHEAAGFETKRGNPAIIMRNSGDEHESLHVSFPTFNNQKGLKIQVLDENDDVKKVFYIIDDKMVKFNVDEGIHSRQHNDRKMLFYSQAEIDNSDVGKYLNLVDKRMQTGVQKLDEAKNATTSRFFNSRMDDSKKMFVSQLQTNLNKFQTELADRLKNSSVDISRAAQQGLADIQKSTTEALEALKQKLIEMIKP